MGAPGQDDKQRNREIARNEVERQTIGNIRIGLAAIAVTIIAGVIVLALGWAWLNR